MELRKLLFLFFYIHHCTSSSLEILPSEKFLPCHFNPLCHCKYSQETEIHQQQLILSNASRKDDPVFEFFCVNVPMAVIPTDYNPHAVLSHCVITGSPLKFIDNSAFAGLQVSNLQLNKNELYFLGEYAFSSMGNSLTVLDLSSNRLDEIPFLAFKPLKHLEWINLANNQLHTIQGDWSGLSTSLRQLTLSANSLQSLPSKLFPAFARLIWLDLSSNFLRNLSQHNLPPNLQTLIVARNPLTKIPLYIFTIKSLSWLVFSSCSIEHIQTDWPRAIATGATQINQLDLRENFIQHWPTRPFSASLRVLDLELSKNYIDKLPAFAFHSMNMFRLSLGYNRIAHIDEEAFATLANTLQYLNLDNNRVGSVPWGALQNLTSLKHLYLGNNGIGDDSLDAIPPTFECNLLYLGMNGNKLTLLPLKLLSRCSHIIHLNLGYNQITSIEPLGSLKLGKLSTLILRNNPIHTVASTFSSKQQFNFPHLYELSLSFTELAQLSPFAALPLTNVEISCGLKTPTTLISATHFQSLKHLEWIALDHNQINSVSPYSFLGNKNITYVNLEFNRIVSLPPKLFHPDVHTNMRELRLGHNRITAISTDTFLSLKSPLTLDLSHNEINVIEEKSFTTVDGKYDVDKQPVSLYLNNNKISVIRNGAFSQEKFELVDLSVNSLSSFSFDSFALSVVTSVGGGVSVGSSSRSVGGVNISGNSLEKVTSARRLMIKWLDLSHNKLQYNGVGLERVCPSQLLDLSWNRIERVDGGLFPVNCSIKEVNLNANQITAVDPDAFSQLRDLTVLHLKGNMIQYVGEILFIRNHKLTFLDMSENKIRSLPRDSLVGSAIEILFLAGNQFVGLPVGALSQIQRRLKILDMSSNSLEHLDSTMFEGIASLVKLNLSSNRLSILPDNAFANLASLRELDLSGNGLRANFKELFHFLPSLKQLSLSNCGIKSFPLLPLPHLTSLDLSSNQMQEIPLQSLQFLDKLRSLDLSNNLLTNNAIPNWRLQNLVTLKLSSNPLKSLVRDLFLGLTRLQSLELLDLDRVDRFDSDVLSYLTNLKVLKVQTYPGIEKYRFRLGNIISGVEGLEELHVLVKEPVLSDQIKGMPVKLKKLTITGPNLRLIQEQAFEGLQNHLHMELTITGTNVEEIPSRLFEVLLNAEVARLDLSYNKISQLSSASLYPNSSFWYSKGTKLLQGGLSLEGNDFNCDCNTVWLGDWMRRWLREAFESHALEPSEVSQMYAQLSRSTCKDASLNSVPLVELYPENICHASALSCASSGVSHTFLVISTVVVVWCCWFS